MDWNILDKKIIKSPRYIFFKKHERLLIFIQGMIVIGLLFGILMFVIQDRGIKEQIKDRCGYTTDTYECVCDKNIVDGWRELQETGEFTINLTQHEDG